MQGTAATGVGLTGLGAGAARGRGPTTAGSEEFTEKVAAGETVYGMSTAFASMDSATVVGNHPATDWVWVDTEHGSYDLEVTRQIVSVIPDDTAALVRVPGAHPKEVERVLDAGADGVIVPFVRTVEEAEAFVESAYYPPDGDRGVAGSLAATDFGLEFEEYYETINDRVFVMLQVETEEAVDNVDEIAQIEGLDCLLIGPADLSHQLGVPFDYENATFQRAIDEVLQAAQRHGVAPGYWVGVDEDEERFAEDGWQVLSLGSDAGLLTNGIDERFSGEGAGDDD